MEKLRNPWPKRIIQRQIIDNSLVQPTIYLCTCFYYPYSWVPLKFRGDMSTIDYGINWRGQNISNENNETDSVWNLHCQRHTQTPISRVYRVECSNCFRHRICQISQYFLSIDCFASCGRRIKSTRSHKQDKRRLLCEWLFIGCSKTYFRLTIYTLIVHWIISIWKILTLT